ncbi:MAG: BrnT family toxin [Deltaproteobacteria bacterium]|nr:BrnT family toxin [Deltaproteobacteria bacterium]
MDFEFDSQKSTSNKKKHGIDFEEIKSLWDDPDLLMIPVKTSDESRFVVIGKIAGKLWSVIITFRSERIRIISARRSRKEEVLLYEGT